MKKKLCISLVLALILLFSLSMAVSASTTITGRSAMPIIQMIDRVNASDQSEAPIQAADAAVEEIAEPESLPPPVTRSSNTPYFVGAGIAILVFIGVAFYCKNNGHKTF